MQTYDYLVVGSGCSGAMAAQSLVEAGVRVAMLDVGISPDEDIAAIPDKSYGQIRKTEVGQHRYLIGDNASGVVWGKVGKGEQITPPRHYIFALTDIFLPIDSDSFQPLESLGYGGLGAGWGLQSWQYSKGSLSTMGLNADKMREAYEVVASRIGISGTKDDAAPYTLGQLKTFQPSAKMDRNHQYILDKYEGHRTAINSRGFILGRTPLALLTQDQGGRKKYTYKDMDFYSDNDRSAWRPWITVNALKKQSNFSYIGGYLLLSFAEKRDHVELNCLNVKTNKRKTFACKKLILATGALGSARIVLRSLAKSTTRLPVLCNPYSYIPCVQPRFVGQALEPKKLGFTQLSLFYREPGHGPDESVASLYSYQSLMLFRIVRHAPLDFVDARIIMRYLMSGLVIMGIHHADRSTPGKYLRLMPRPNLPTGDILHVNYDETTSERHEILKREKQYLKIMRKMGTYGLKVIRPESGASIHYAGTIPFSETPKDFRLAPNGRLHGTRRVYVADSSGFNFLPAQGLTFTLMANAHIIAENVLHDN